VSASIDTVDSRLGDLIEKLPNEDKWICLHTQQ
jgi:hypothetical protein